MKTTNDLGDTSRTFRSAVLQNDVDLVATILSEERHPSVYDFKLAVEKDSKSILELFLKDGYDINREVSYDHPPALADAIFDRDLTEWLLQKGADPNARCYYGDTPTSKAAGYGSLEVIELLFKHGASAKQGGVLHCAVRRERENDVLEFLISQGASLSEIEFQDDAVCFNHYSCFTALGTPLHEAAKKKNDRIINLLLSHGADPTIKDSRGMVPAITEKSKI